MSEANASCSPMWPLLDRKISANVSANGLRFEGIEVAHWLEAAIQTVDSDEVKSAQQWFPAKQPQHFAYHPAQSRQKIDHHQ